MIDPVARRPRRRRRSPVKWVVGVVLAAAFYAYQRGATDYLS